jgi:hypothetical protein
MGFFIPAFIIAMAIVAFVVISEQKKNKQNLTAATSDVQNNGFTISRQVSNPDNNFSLLIDNTHSKWAITRGSDHAIFDYSDLIEYELLEDGESLVKGRVGSAIIGGMLFGGIGAVAGASRSKKVKSLCSSMSVRIIVNNPYCPQYIIPIISSQIKTDGLIYNTAKANAQDFTALLALIKAKAET